MSLIVSQDQREHARAMLGKATNDYLVAEYHAKRSWPPTFDAICFHSQQCIEKALKAYIAAVGRKYPFTHSLGDLLNVAIKQDDDFTQWRNDCNYLTGFAVVPRYPDEIAITEDISARAFAKAEKVFFNLLQKLQSIDSTLLNSDAVQLWSASIKKGC